MQSKTKFKKSIQFVKCVAQIYASFLDTSMKARFLQFTNHEVFEFHFVKVYWDEEFLSLRGIPLTVLDMTQEELVNYLANRIDDDRNRALSAPQPTEEEIREKYDRVHKLSKQLMLQVAKLFE
jgi:hypothetical protein